MFRRIATIFIARNREFYRDKTGLGWNFLFPLLIIFGFSFLFSDSGKTFSKIGMVDVKPMAELALTVERFTAARHADVVPFDSVERGLVQLRKQRVDLLFDPSTGRYWVNGKSPGGYAAEQFLMAADHTDSTRLLRNEVTGKRTRYVEWLFPGILGMNMMFSSLFGVGYVIVRYRKNGVLKRMSVTPLRPWEFLTAQIVSRLFLICASASIVFTACHFLYGFTCEGPLYALLLCFVAGGFSIISLAVILASRTESEEFAEGVLNLIAWPMMFLSEVWFSLEGASPMMVKAASLLPLSHFTKAARMVMNEGAGVMDILPDLGALTLMSIVFLTIGAHLFCWHRDG